MGASNFTGKTAVITGSARGFGRCLSMMLASEGANVVINAKSSADLVDSTVDEIRSLGGAAIGVLADISQPESVDQLAGTVIEEFGHVDILVNCAGIRPLGSILEVDMADWHSVLDVKLTGALLCSQAFIPGMVAGGFGRIVNVAGIDAFWGNARKVHVGTANYGLIGFTRSLAMKLASSGITVNAVVPGAFDTERSHPEWYAGDDFEEIARRIPMQRLGRPEELAAVCRFLVHDDASYVTGQTIHVNGGAYPTR